MGNASVLLAAWDLTSTIIQVGVIDAESGFNTFEDLDFGPLREHTHSEALVKMAAIGIRLMMAAFGIRSTEKAAARLHPDAQRRSVLVSLKLVLI